MRYLVLAGALAIGACSAEPPAPSKAPAPAAPASQAGRALVAGRTTPGAIVTLEPTTPREYPAPADVRVMDQFGQQFIPDMLVARVGQKVEFRSSEDVLHNVRVDQVDPQETIFNVATPSFGSYTHVFEKPGYYRVSCDVHPAMRANIFVTATPYAVVANASGAFTIPDVEPGSYTARTYAAGTPTERVVQIAAPRTELTLGKP